MTKKSLADRIPPPAKRSKDKPPIPKVDPDGQFFCETCVLRFDATGDCPKCNADHLVDLLNEDVLLMLQAQDARRFQARVGMLTGVAFVLCLPLLTGVLVLNLKFVLLVYGTAVVGLAGVLNALFRAPRTTPDMGQSF